MNKKNISKSKNDENKSVSDKVVIKRVNSHTVEDNKIECFQSLASDSSVLAVKKRTNRSIKADVVVDYHDFIRSIIILHGWNQSAYDMQSLEVKMREQFTTHLEKSINIYRWSYPFLLPFDVSSKKLLFDIKQQNITAKSTIIVGYSMGGVVARQLFVDGFDFHALVSICSPHQGLGVWVPTPDQGSGSLSPFSLTLAALNNHPRDVRKRIDYNFFGIKYKDIRGSFNDDGVVTVESATGKDLGAGLNRYHIDLSYSGFVWPPSDPHSKGNSVVYLDPVISRIKAIIMQRRASAIGF